MIRMPSVKFWTLKWLFAFHLLVAIVVVVTFRQNTDAALVRRLETAGVTLRSSATFDYGSGGNISRREWLDPAERPPTPPVDQITGAFILSDWDRPAVLSDLSKLPNLELVYLANTDASDSDMAHLARLKNVRMIDLENTQITDRGLLQLAPIQSLKIIAAARTRVTQQGIDQFRKLRPDVKVVMHPR